MCRRSCTDKFDPEDTLDQASLVINVFRLKVFANFPTVGLQNLHNTHWKLDFCSIWRTTSDPKALTFLWPIPLAMPEFGPTVVQGSWIITAPKARPQLAVCQVFSWQKKTNIRKFLWLVEIRQKRSFGSVHDISWLYWPKSFSEEIWWKNAPDVAKMLWILSHQRAGICGQSSACLNMCRRAPKHVGRTETNYGQTWWNSRFIFTSIYPNKPHYKPTQIMRRTT